MPNIEIIVAFIGAKGIINGLEGFRAFGIANTLPNKKDTTKVIISKSLSNRNVIFSIKLAILLLLN
ncbi:MAG: hypothetical protein ACI4PF_01775 [Christensenellales bacterium]